MNVKAFSTCLVAASLVLAGCASTTVTPSAWTAERPHTGDVAVYHIDSEVKVPFKIIGKVNHSDPGKFQRLDINDALPIIKEKAAQMGGNGVIIDHEGVIYSGLISRGIDVTARVIKY